MKITLTALLGALAISTGFVSATPARAEPTSMFILDVSGSMWGRLPDRQSKIVAARKVMGELVGKLPDSISAGLIAYGHRRKGDCSDIELVQKPVKGGGTLIAKRLGSLVPRGRTPITDALKLAAETLTGIEDRTTIVLVSDGIETCKGDPCALAEALAKSSANLKIHVVGYAVGGDARDQLQCIAEKGRGAYFKADSVGGLVEAMTRLTDSIRKAEDIDTDTGMPDPSVTSIDITLDGPGKIKLKLGDWTHAPRYWKVLNPETGEVIAKTDKDEIEVMPGQYQIAWRHLEHGAREVTLPQVIDVSSGMTSAAYVTTGLKLVAPKGLRKPYYWQLLPEGVDLKTSYRRRLAAAWYWVWDAVPVPAGRYTLVFRQTEHGHQEVVLGSVDLKEGELTRLPLDQGINLAWLKAWGDIYYLKLTDSTGRSVKMEYAGPVVLAPGTYKLALRLKEHTHNEAPFGTITVPEKGFVDPGLTSGISFVTARKGEFTVYAVNLDTGEEAKMYKSWGPMPLGAGRYRFELKIGHQKRQVIVPKLAIKAGQFIKARIK